MSSKKILIIARDFLPYCRTLGGVIRVLKLAEYLSSQGVDVTVLAAKGYEVSYFGYEKLVKQLNVEYVEDGYQKYMTRTQSASNSSAKQSLLSNVATLIRKVINEASIPDIGVFYGKGLYSRACELISNYNYTNVYVSSPPHSTQVIGFRLKRRFGARINLIAEYRDSWNTIGIFSKKTNIGRWLSEKLERAILKRCDSFIYHSPRVIDKITSQIIDVRSKSLLVTNGYDPNMRLPHSSIRPKNTILTIGHFGGISDKANSFRDPTPFLESIARSTTPVKLVLYGPALINQIWEKRLGDHLELRGSIPHDQALAEMAKMDVLMLLHSQRDGAEEVIPGKLYEYVLAERPILVVGPKNMEAARIIEEKKLGYTMDIYDPLNMDDVLQDIYCSWKNGALPRLAVDEHPEFSRNFQYAKLTQLLR